MSELSLTFESKEDSLSVRRFRVREALSTLFDVSIRAQSPNGDIDLESIVGKKAGFLIMGGAMGSPQVWSGVASHMELVRAEPTGLSTYDLRIAPSLWRTKKKRNNRVFEHMTVPAIVTKVLEDYGIEPELSIRQTHEEHEYRVQFAESDFAFICRLLEEEGISFSFQQVDERDGFTTKLVLSDSPETVPPHREPLPFVDNPNEAARQAFVTRVRISQRVCAGATTVRDFDFVTPDRRLDGAATPARAPEDFYEQYHFAPASFIKDRKGAHRIVSDAEAKRRADIFLESKRARRREVAFRTNAHDLRPGMVMAIARHPREDLGAENRLLLVASVVEGTHDREWTTDLRAVFASLPHRPEQTTPRPVMRGPESAIVVGPHGDEIHTDEFGRVRVQFHWDRQGHFDDRSSCWVRVSQGWAGAAFGQIVLPRVGQEVLVDFFDGDADHPVVVGSVYNARTRVPYTLPDEKTRSTWKSNSSPHSEGFNEIMFEDKAGHELVYVQAERDLSKLVKHDEIDRTGHNQVHVVGANRSTITAAEETSLVGSKHTVATAKVKDLRILALADAKFAMQKTAYEMVDQKIALTTGSSTTVVAARDITLDARSGVIMQSGGEIVIEGAHVYINTKRVASQKLKANADLTDRAAKPKGRTLGAIKDAFAQKEQATEPEGAATEIKVIRQDLPVPHRIQIGPTCGIAATGMVLDFWHAKDATQKNPSDRELLELAKLMGLTEMGETHSAGRAQLARQLGYDAMANACVTIDKLKQVVAAGTPPIVDLNIDDAGDPDADQLNYGHAVVVKGFFSDEDGKEHIVATHGWSTAETKVWPLDEFAKSWDARGGRMTVIQPRGTV